MKAVIQRVKLAGVSVCDDQIAAIGEGLAILIGFQKGDEEEDVTRMVEKIVNLRIFTDSKNKMNLSVIDVGGEVLVVPQFTLIADIKAQNRPFFGNAEKPERAKELFLDFAKKLKQYKLKKVEMGQFGAYMKVSLINDGPVTLVIEIPDSRFQNNE